MKYFIANWKANKNYEETVQWMKEFEELVHSDSTIKYKLSNKEICIIICPPFPLIQTLKPLEEKFQNVYIGSQSVSDATEGSYTAEVTAETLKGLVGYSIVGHSERRKNYGETNDQIAKKVQNCLSEEIKPILCVRDENDSIPEGSRMIAFEPISAIGTGQNMKSDEVIQMKNTLSLSNDTVFIYGGSVKPDTVSEYLKSPELDGFLIGGASLDAKSFLDIVSQG